MLSCSVKIGCQLEHTRRRPCTNQCSSRIRQCLPFRPYTRMGRKDFLKKSTAHSTSEAYEFGRHLDHAGRIADSPSDNKRKAARALLRDAIPKRDFSPPIVTRASKILIPMICNAARASRPGLAVGILRVLCNDMCTAHRFHTDDEEQRCRVGCPDEPHSLSHHNECPLLYNLVIAAWRTAAVRPRRDHLFHDRTRVSEGETAVAPYPDGRLQGGRLALVPFFSKLGMAPFGGPGDRNFDAGARFRGLFLCLSHPFWRFQNIKVGVCKKSFETPCGWTKNACCLRHGFTKMCFLYKAKCTLQKCIFFRNFEPPHFCTVFSTICGTVVNNNGPRG